jgi:D-alanine-D-alanine ligase
MPPPDRSNDWTRRLKAIGNADLSDLRRFVSQRYERLSAFMGTGAAAAPDSGSRWLRPKGNLTRAELAVLLTIATLPLLMMVIRISALPGVLGPGLSGSLLPAIGHDLNEFLSLHQIPAGDRGRVLYLLFLPTGAMLIALARLTFGLRVIGFRAILIAVGFQQSGIIPGMILIGVMVFIVVAIRPTLVRFRLPYYARVSVIMSISVLVLLSALLLAPWMRSDVVWRLGFFPVLVLGLLAEGIAKTLDRDNGLTATWRTGMTIGIALLLAGIGQIPLLREIAIQFPELVFTQIVAIILISEFLDLRLFQDWDARLSGFALPRLFSESTALRVAIVRNHRRNGIIGRLGASSRNGYPRRVVRRIANALSEGGHTVKVVEGDITLLSKLRDFIPPDPQTGQPGGIVLNLSHGIQGDIAAAHVPAMLEMSGVAYTGAAQQGQLLALDKVLSSAVLTRAGVPTPEPRVFANPGDVGEGLAYPLVVKPRYAPHYKLRVAKNREQLAEAVRLVTRSAHQQAVAEPYISGREIHVAMIGNDPVECLPLVESRPGREEWVCPASLPSESARRIEDAARSAFKACACRDYALATLRIGEDGTPCVVEIGETDALEPGGSFELAAEAAGYSYAQLIDRILAIARKRYQSGATVPTLERAPESGAEVPRVESPLVARS